MYTTFWSDNLKGREHLKDVGVDGNRIHNGSGVYPAFYLMGTRDSSPGGEAAGV
jgi:hypothetical protein